MAARARTTDLALMVFVSFGTKCGNSWFGQNGIIPTHCIFRLDQTTRLSQMLRFPHTANSPRYSQPLRPKPTNLPDPESREKMKRIGKI
jgi:hypothetical protein